MNLKNALLPKIGEPIIKRNLPRADRIFLISVLALAAFGTLMVFSAGYAYADFKYDDPLFFVKKQSIWLIIGLAVMYLASHISPSFYRALTPIFYMVTIALLILVLAVGFVGNGAQRWISIGPLTIQPSELAKTTIVMALALYFSENEDKALDRKNNKNIFLFGTLLPVLIFAVPILLVMLQKHLSCIIILGIIGLLVTVCAGVRTKYITLFSGIGASLIAALALFTDYTKERITVWLNPEAYRLTGGWQTLQGLMAIGSGGIFGLGLGKSLLKYCYVSEPANDMIFAILCEELGLIGAAFALALFALVIGRGYHISARASCTYERLVIFGICTKIAAQTLLNVAVVTNSIPNTGISLPFFSYGGSSLIMLFFEIGMILSFSRYAKIQK